MASIRLKKKIPRVAKGAVGCRIQDPWLPVVENTGVEGLEDVGWHGREAFGGGSGQGLRGTIDGGADRLNVPANRQVQALVLRGMCLAHAKYSTIESVGSVHTLGERAMLSSCV